VNIYHHGHKSSPVVTSSTLFRSSRPVIVLNFIALEAEMFRNVVLSLLRTTVDLQELQDAHCTVLCAHIWCYQEAELHSNNTFVM
jgi:hypothetical protein